MRLPGAPWGSLGLPGAPWGSLGLPRSPKKFFKSSSTHAPLGLPGAPFERGSWNSSKFLLNFFKNDRFDAGSWSVAAPKKVLHNLFPPWGPLGLPGAPWGSLGLPGAPWGQKPTKNHFENGFCSGNTSKTTVLTLEAGPGPVPARSPKSSSKFLSPLGPPGAPWGSLGLPGAPWG